MFAMDVESIADVDTPTTDGTVTTDVTTGRIAARAGATESNPGFQYFERDEVKVVIVRVVKKIPVGVTAGVTAALP